MSNSRKLDIDNWKRKDHYNFFRHFDEPFFGVCVDVDCTSAYRRAKELGVSFFLYYLHKSIVAVNQTEAFRYRINEEDEILVYDTVEASPTINRPDGTFGYGYFSYDEDFDAFRQNAATEIEKVRNATGLIPAVSGENVIHYSSIPWINFKSISHARSFSHKDSIPKISFGKLHDDNGQLMMPVSIHVHHGLMDGYDVGKHLDLFQKLLG
ncbi:MAG: chloramphenicol acetyltransferase [Bacteroidota bacterium]